jgi:transcriptional regulator with XRE-family HTH domain
MTVKKRPLNPIELAAQDRFKSIWEQKKRELRLTQEAVALACGWSGQTAFTQFLCGNTPLNTEAVLKLSKALQIHPTEIMPEIADLLPEGRGRATASSDLPPEDLALAKLINELPEEQRVALQSVASAFSNKIKKQAANVKQSS